ncbi:hypothetical protein BP5796_09906 [Coleophoma crateriformis]|uniref:Galactosyl transferase GMA12/MNN10 family protein n=1 Tax=Coleophoma crateriformis TaxID=565419 RepID=A0A3D8QUP1_9HELO|nr:hypothetical protein BP5796_09906 [Coleophoma crateriformis]
MYVLRENILRGLWSKPAYISAVIEQELAKPPSKRLKWLFWTDADLVLMNPNIPLDIFLPPEPEFKHIDVLVTKDVNGLNNGVFAVRVNANAARLFSAVVSWKIYKPDVRLKYNDQSALENLLSQDLWVNKTAWMPQRWINAYPVKMLNATTLTNKKPLKYNFRAGDLLIHFAGNQDHKRHERMAYWMNIAEKHLPQYEVPLDKTSLKKDIGRFWDSQKKKRAKA